MNDLPLGFSVDLPVGQLLQRAGSSVARMTLLDNFSAKDAESLTDGRFGDKDVSAAVEVLFVEDPVTGLLRPRPKLELEVLDSINDLYPTALPDLANRLISQFIGPEGLSSGELLSWMLRNRWRPLERAAISALAAFSPFELAEVCRQILLHRESTVERALLAPYGGSAARWSRALARSRRGASDYLSLDPLDALASLHESPDPTNARTAVKEPRRLERRVGSYRDGYLPQTFELLSRKAPQRLAHQVHLRPTASPWTGQAADRHLRVASTGDGGASPAKDSDQLITLLARSSSMAESTRQLLSLVLQNRGPGMITEIVNISVGSGDCQRHASISITESQRINDMLYSYLGALPTSVGGNLPVSVRGVGGDKLIVGGGSIVSRYREEVALALSRLQDSVEASVISASDWGRLERSLREPWRFVSSRDYIELEVVDAEWMEPLESEIESLEVWPFRGASPRTLLLEGFRAGDDDHYSSSARILDGFRIRALELRSVPRGLGEPAVERPSRIRIYADWQPASYVLMIAAVIVSVASLVSVASFSNYLGMNEYDLLNSASLIASFSAPIVAVLASSAFRPSNTSTTIRSLLSRLGGVAALTLMLVVLTLVSDFSSILRTLMIALDVLVAGLLSMSLAISLWTRRSTLRRVLRQYKLAFEASGRRRSI